MSVGVTRDLVLTEWAFRGIHINTATSSYDLVPSDSGIMFVNDYGTATTYNLPAVALGKGKIFFFLNSEGAAATVISASTACIKGRQAAVCTVLTSAAVGDWAMVVGDGTNYFLFAEAGAWTVTT